MADEHVLQVHLRHSDVAFLDQLAKFVEEEGRNLTNAMESKRTHVFSCFASILLVHTLVLLLSWCAPDL